MSLEVEVPRDPGEFGFHKFRPIEEIRERARVLFPDASREQVQVMQQRALPDQRYGVNNWPSFDVRNYTGVKFDVHEYRTKPRPYEGGMPYIPVAHILEQQPALDLFDVRVDQPNLFDIYTENPHEDPRTVNENADQRKWEHFEQSKGRHLINSRGAWNEMKQLEFIWKTRDRDPQLSLYHTQPPPIDVAARRDKLEKRGLLRRMDGSQ